MFTSYVGRLLFTEKADNYRVLGKNKKAAKRMFSGLAVAREGFEPPQTEPKSVVLPLDDRAIASANVG